jgi:hypothetical protein
MTAIFSRLSVSGLLITLLTISSIQLAFAGTWLSYDDGTADGAWACITSNPIYAVKFTLPDGWTNARLLTVSAFKTPDEISADQGELNIQVLSSDFSTVLAGPFLFLLDPPGGFFRSVSVPGEVVVPSEFYIVLTGAPEACIGLDSSSTGHTYDKDLPDGSWTIFPQYDLMVRVEVGQTEFPPVAGVASSINKLELLTPYLALAGLVIAVSTIYVIKRRKD